MSYNGEHGLMAEIQSLVSPPGYQNAGAHSDPSKETQKQASKRTSRVKENCEACDSPGELLYCENCSLPFHPECDEPPIIDLQSIIDVAYRCRSCRVLSKDTKLTSILEGQYIVGRRAKRIANENVTTQARKSVGVGVKHPVARVLFKVSSEEKKKNPKKYALPSQYSFTKYLFPGRSKPVKKTGAEKAPKTQKAAEGYSTVAKMSGTCFVCAKGPRRGELIQCDYCSQKFHLDCLDPPLTTTPRGMWMCPQHPHGFIESRLLQNSSLTERVRVWDLVQEPLDPKSIVTKFVNKVSKTKYLNALRRKPEAKKEANIEVPDYIKAAYDRLSDSVYNSESVPVYDPDLYSCYLGITIDNKPVIDPNSLQRKVTPKLEVGNLFLRGPLEHEKPVQLSDHLEYDLTYDQYLLAEPKPCPSRVEPSTIPSVESFEVNRRVYTVRNNNLYEEIVHGYDSDPFCHQFFRKKLAFRIDGNVGRYIVYLNRRLIKRNYVAQDYCKLFGKLKRVNLHPQTNARDHMLNLLSLHGRSMNLFKLEGSCPDRFPITATIHELSGLEDDEKYDAFTLLDIAEQHDANLLVNLDYDKKLLNQALAYRDSRLKEDAAMDRYWYTMEEHEKLMDTLKNASESGSKSFEPSAVDDGEIAGPSSSGALDDGKKPPTLKENISSMDVEEQNDDCQGTGSTENEKLVLLANAAVSGIKEYDPDTKKKKGLFARLFMPVQRYQNYTTHGKEYPKEYLPVYSGGKLVKKLWTTRVNCLEPEIIIRFKNDRTGFQKTFKFKKGSYNFGTSPSSHVRLNAICPACELLNPDHVTLFFSGEHWEMLNYGASGILCNGIMYGVGPPSRKKQEKEWMNNPESMKSLFWKLVKSRKGSLDMALKRRTPESANLGTIGCPCEKDFAPFNSNTCENAVELRPNDEIFIGCVSLTVLKITIRSSSEEVCEKGADQTLTEVLQTRYDQYLARKKAVVESGNISSRGRKYNAVKKSTGEPISQMENVQRLIGYDPSFPYVGTSKSKKGKSKSTSQSCKKSGKAETSSSNKSAKQSSKNKTRKTKGTKRKRSPSPTSSTIEGTEITDESKNKPKALDEEKKVDLNESQLQPHAEVEQREQSNVYQNFVKDMNDKTTQEDTDSANRFSCHEEQNKDDDKPSREKSPPVVGLGIIKSESSQKPTTPPPPIDLQFDTIALMPSFAEASTSDLRSVHKKKRSKSKSRKKSKKKSKDKKSRRKIKEVKVEAEAMEEETPLVNNYRGPTEFQEAHDKLLATIKQEVVSNPPSEHGTSEEEGEEEESSEDFENPLTPKEVEDGDKGESDSVVNKNPYYPFNFRVDLSRPPRPVRMESRDREEDEGKRRPFDFMRDMHYPLSSDDDNDKSRSEKNPKKKKRRR